MERAVEELQANINRLLPGYLEHPNDVLSDKKIRHEFKARQESRYRRRAPFRELSSFEDTLFNALEAQCFDLSAKSEPDEWNAPEPAQLALEKACHRLEMSIAGQRASASFACGGIIPIELASPRKSSLQNSSGPVQIFWVNQTSHEAHMLELPLKSDGNPASSVARLNQLVGDCQPASFGRGHQDVIDPSYRKAGKLDPSQFATSFHPADFGIVDHVEQILLPAYQTEAQSCLPFQKLRAELYKLNVCRYADQL